MCRVERVGREGPQWDISGLKYGGVTEIVLGIVSLLCMNVYCGPSLVVWHLDW